MAESGLGRIRTVAANTFRETVRERVLLNLVLFAVLMTLSGLLLKDLSIRQDEKIIKDVGLASMDLFGTLIALFVGVGLVAKEIERRSLYPLLAKPLGRVEFLVGKFLGLAFTLLVNLVVMSAGLYLTLLTTAGRADLRLLKGIYAIYLSLLLVVAIAQAFSTVTSTVLSAVCTFGVVVAGRFSDVVRNVEELTTGAPVWLTRFVYYAIPNFRNFDFKHRVVYGDPVSWSDLGVVTLYAALYTAIVMVIAAAAFRRRDL
jgi:ABC-type transport system involved in multi-copper enzyme maturation permease subunit